MLKNIIKYSIIVNVGLFLGRLVGFLREIIIADKYGAGDYADVAILVLTLPDVMVNILVGGALSAVLIPAFSRDKERSFDLFFQASIFFGLFAFLISFVLSINSGLVTSIIAPGLKSEVLDKASDGVMAVVYVIPFFVLTGVSTAILHFRNQFLVVGLGTFIFNVVVVFMLVVSNSDLLVFYVVLSVFFGALLRWVSQLVVLFYKQSRPHLKDVFDGFLIDKGLIFSYFQAVISGGVLFVYPVIARSYSSYDGSGGVAIFSYATKLIELPLLFCVSFLSIVLFPKLSIFFNEDKSKYNQYVFNGFQLSFALSLVAVVTIAAVSESYVRVVYGMGLSEDALQRLLVAFRTGLVLVILQGLVTYFMMVLHSSGKHSIPLYFNGVGMAALWFSLASYESLAVSQVFMVMVYVYVFLLTVYFVFICFVLDFFERFLADLYFILCSSLIAFLFGFVLKEVKGFFVSDIFIVGLGVLFGLLCVVAISLCHKKVFKYFREKLLDV